MRLNWKFKVTGKLDEMTAKKLGLIKKELNTLFFFFRGGLLK